MLSNRRLVVLTLIVAAGLVLVAAMCSAQGMQPKGGQGKGGQGMRGGGGGRGGGFADMGYVERTWAEVTFEAKATQTQLAQLRPAFQKAWASRKAAMTSARKSQSFQGLSGAMTKIRAGVEAKLKVVLTAPQRAILAKLENERRQMAEQFRRAAAAQGGGQGKGGQGKGGGRGGR